MRWNKGIRMSLEEQADKFYKKNEIVSKGVFFTLDKGRARALRNFLYDNGYISRVDYNEVHEILVELDKFLGEK